MKESLLEKKVCIYAKEKKWLVFKMISTYQKGLPDRIFLKNSFVFFIEFKTKKNKISLIQKEKILNLKKNKFYVFIISDFLNGIKIINKMDKIVNEKN